MIPEQGHFGRELAKHPVSAFWGAAFQGDGSRRIGQCLCLPFSPPRYLTLRPRQPLYSPKRERQQCSPCADPQDHSNLYLQAIRCWESRHAVRPSASIAGVQDPKGQSTIYFEIQTRTHGQSKTGGIEAKRSL